MQRAGGGHGVGGAGKDGEEAIALAPLDDHAAAVGGDALVEDGVVVGEGDPHGRGMLLPARGTTFDVGEQERDDPAGHGGHCGSLR